MTSHATIVRSFYERMQARNWDSAAELLAPTITIEFTETGERFEGANFLAMNRAYPEGWTIEVVETVSEGDRVAAQVRVSTEAEVFWCAGFYLVAEDMIQAGTEHWVTEGSQAPPPWRDDFSS